MGDVKRDAVFVEAAARSAAKAYVFAQTYQQKKRSKKLERIGLPLVAASAAHLWR